VLVDINPSVPVILFGGMALLASAGTFLLPFDTSQLKLTDSLPSTGNSKKDEDRPPLLHQQYNGNTEEADENSALKGGASKRTTSGGSDMDIII